MSGSNGAVGPQPPQRRENDFGTCGSTLHPGQLPEVPGRGNHPPAGPSGAEDDRLGSGTHTLTVAAAGYDWDCPVHVPAAYDARHPHPLVLVLHGAGGSGPMYLDRNGWAAKAEEQGFLVVAPNGLPALPAVQPDFRSNPRLWNTGQLKPRSPRAQIDDLLFFRALLTELERRLHVDQHRIYVTGHSNGAGMTFRLGIEMAERFAALAPVASPCWTADPRPVRPRPTLYIVGTVDPLVPLAGGDTTSPWGKRTMPPVDQTLRRWAAALGCATEPQAVREDLGVKVVEYGPGREGVAFTVCFVKEQGHGWPGGQSEGLPARMIGPRTDKFKATDAIWEFFAAHARP